MKNYVGGVKQLEAEELAMEECDVGAKEQQVLYYFQKIPFIIFLFQRFLLGTHRMLILTQEASIHLSMV